MAIVQVIPGSAAQPWGGELDERGNSRYRETWTVITDDPQDGPLVVSNAPGLPIRHSSYRRGNDVHLQATLKRIQVERRSDTLTVWDLNYEWDTANESQDQGDTNPLVRRREKQWTAIPYDAVVEKDYYGHAILNAAFDEFDPPVMRHKFGLRLTYTRNLATENDVAYCMSYLNTVNNDQFQGFAPGAACCVDASASEEFDENSFFWKTTMVFEFRRIINNPTSKYHMISSDGNISQIPSTIVYPWDLAVLNNGFYEIGEDGKKTRIKDDDGKNCVSPWRLTALGTRLPGHSPSSEAVFFMWRLFEYRPFAPLGII